MDEGWRNLKCHFFCLVNINRRWNEQQNELGFLFQHCLFVVLIFCKFRRHWQCWWMVMWLLLGCQIFMCDVLGWCLFLEEFRFWLRRKMEEWWFVKRIVVRHVGRTLIKNLSMVVELFNKIFKVYCQDKFFFFLCFIFYEDGVRGGCSFIFYYHYVQILQNLHCTWRNKIGCKIN
jgi:hypothetical protein